MSLKLIAREVPSHFGWKIWQRLSEVSMAKTREKPQVNNFVPKGLHGGVTDQCPLSVTEIPNLTNAR